MPCRFLVVALSTLAAAAAPARAQSWTQWRGPHFDGSAEAGGLPATWSRTEGVAWATPLPGPAAATPSVSGGRIFLTAKDRESGALLALGLDRKTGAVLWRRAHGEGWAIRQRGFENTGAECSPASDGRRAWFLFGNGVLVAYDLDGQELWKRDLVEAYGPFQVGWGYASSPLLLDGRLYVQCLRTGPSYLLAVDPETGRTLFKHDRHDDATAESVEAYTSPLPFTREGTTSVLVLGADCLTAHDPATGEERWRWSGLNPEGRGRRRRHHRPRRGRRVPGPRPERHGLVPEPGQRRRRGRAADHPNGGHALLCGEGRQ